MTSPFQKLAQEEYSQNPELGGKNPYRSPFEEIANYEENQESFWKSSARTALQIPQGLAEGTKGGIAAGVWQLLAQGEILDPEELDRIKEISEREGVPFDEDAYMEAAEKALGTIPTVSNIASKIEEKTGLPLEPKTRVQKGLRFASTASKLAPKDYTFRGMNTSLPRPVLGAGVEGANEVLQEMGVPEPFAQIASFGVIKPTSQGAGRLSFTKEKPSGLPEMQFENIKESKAIPEKKLQQINEKLETDFKTISDNIIKDSPIGETAENLKNDPTFKQQSRDLLNQAQQIADSSPGNVSTKSIKKELADISSKNVKGFSLNEYDKSYLKFMKESIKDIIPENVTHGELVEQYRKNNASLSEYFEPGSSKALNRAKRDAILDQNRAIANVLEKSNPELYSVFKEGNARWTKIMDTEAVDSFVNELFSDKVNYKKMHDFFDKSGYDRIFKRALGEEGYKSFDQLLKDMLTSETPYKMLKVAKSQGFNDLFKTGLGYIIHPNLGYAKAGLDALKYSYRGLVNAMLDEPKVAINFKKAISDLKKGDFKAAENDFKALQVEIKVLPMEEAPKGQTRTETIEVTPERMTQEKPLQSEKNKK